MLDYPQRLHLAQLPTPLQCLERLSTHIGGPRIWVKRDDLTDCAASGNKIRKLEFTLARALDQGCDTVITCGGVQSNHCRATALLGARLGLQVHLILRDENTGITPEETPDGNLLLDFLAGASVSVYPRQQYQTQLAQLCAHWVTHYTSQGRKPYQIPTGASDGTGVWGYVGCAQELKNDFARLQIQPGAIVHATGSGGTQAGLTAGAALYDLDCPVVGMAVCDNADYFRRKVRADLQEWRHLYGVEIDIDRLAIIVNDAYIGPGYAQAGQEVFATIRDVAALEGLILDPVYSGKAFHGMLEEIRHGAFSHLSDVVFIHTGGIFGLFAQRHALGYHVPSQT